MRLMLADSKGPYAMNFKFIHRIVLASAALVLGTAGCQKKEKVLDVKTPAGDIEVERDKKTGDIDIKIEDKK